MHVSLVNEGGQAIGHKEKSALLPGDIYHSVFVFLVTPLKEVVVSRMSEGRLSATAVGLNTPGETPEQTALRATSVISPQEVPQLRHLGDQFYTAANGRKTYISVFYGTTHATDIQQTHVAMTAAEVDAAADSCTPALRFIWNSYRHMLPV